MSPSLAQLVRKWLKTYSTKNQWSFRYAWDSKKEEDDLSKGYLQMEKSQPGWSEHPMPRPTIKIENNEATIGEFRNPPWGGSDGQWTKTVHSDVKLLAADPRFFSKLDKVMQFLTREAQRREENNKKFAQEESARLKDILR
jgi:hypothetical protein